MKIKKWLESRLPWFKKWGALISFLVPTIISMGALTISFIALHDASVQYQEVTKPSAQSSQIYDKLNRLDLIIDRSQKFIDSQPASNEINQYRIELNEAGTLREKAETDWANGSYSESNQFIKQAFNILGNIPVSTPFLFNYWWILALVVLVVALGSIIIITTRQKRAS